MMENIFDSHAHYDDPAFDPDRDELLASLPGAGVCGIISCGTDVATSRYNLELAHRYNHIWAAAGFHPEAADRISEKDFVRLRELLADKRCVAVGELGLDYHYEDGAAREVQLSVLERQLQLANELDMPVIFHDRDAHADTLEILKKYRPKGVVHCFSGSVEMAQEIVGLGMYIGLGGAVTFKNARKPVAVAQYVPAERLLIETDCPYMTPVPFRGKRNDSALIANTAQKLAEIRGCTPEQILLDTRQNAERLFLSVLRA